MNLQGNTVLITGATSGLGKAFAEAFYAAGSKVILCGRREERLMAMQAQYTSMDYKVVDVSNAIERNALKTWTLQNHPATNIIINNAGVQYAFDFQAPIDTNKMQEEVNTNFIAPIHLSNLFVEVLRNKPKAAIINISSGLSFVPIAFMPVYCATKAGIHSFTMSLRHQLKNTSIKVFEIAPPAVDTELGHDRREDKTQSHGGIPIAEFIAEAMDAISNDLYEAPIGQSKGLRAKREELFEMLNNH